jgi:Spy/CpxP family protein refolding chaperone
LLGLAGVPLLLAGALAAPAVAAAAEEGIQGRGARMCAKLECTDDQKEELRAIFAEARQDARGDHEAIKRLAGEMKAEFATDDPDEQRLRDLQAEIATHRNELASRRLDAMLDVHELLTPEQRTTLIEMMEKRRAKFGEHRGKRRKGKKAE